MAPRSSNSKVSRLTFVLLTAAFTGCAAERFEYHAGTETPEGPGMLTGKEGAIVLYRGPAPEHVPAETARAPASSSGATSISGPASDAEFKEFQEFKRWKDANRDSPEYREFREWKRWKAFRAWEAQQRGRQD